MSRFSQPEELLTTARLVQQGKQGLGIALQGGESEFQQYEEHRQGQEEDHVQATFDRYSPDHDKFIEGFAAQRTGVGASSVASGLDECTHVTPQTSRQAVPSSRSITICRPVVAPLRLQVPRGRAWNTTRSRCSSVWGQAHCHRVATGGCAPRGFEFVTWEAGPHDRCDRTPRRR